MIGLSFVALFFSIVILIWDIVLSVKNGEKRIDLMQENWILCKDSLPPEPEEDTGEYECYLVTIDNGGIYAIESTYLYYYGDGEWIDFATDISYCVVAWQPFPAAYRKTLYQRMLEDDGKELMNGI